MTCPTCGQPMPALNSHGKPRKFCTAGCAAIVTGVTFPKVRDLYAEEVEHLTQFGTPPATICDQLSVTPTALARALQRENRPDLARPYDRLVRLARTNACLGCGKVRASKHPRCWACARQHRANLERTAA